MRASRIPGSRDLRRTKATRRIGSPLQWLSSTAAMALNSRRRSPAKSWKQQRYWVLFWNRLQRRGDWMAISDVIEKLGRALFEAPFGTNRLAKDAPELAEIRLAVLDAIKAKSHRANGKHVFPYNLVRIQLLGVPREQKAVFASTFLTSYFTQELKSGLARSNYRFPEDLAAEIHTTPELPMPGMEWITVETHLIRSAEDVAATQEIKPARLTVIHGVANRPEILLKKARTNIGRTVEVYRGASPSRRNDLAFTEENETNKSVSREHAHIV